jgi:tetratricopeptide (TPR) repeat protein
MPRPPYLAVAAPLAIVLGIATAAPSAAQAPALDSAVRLFDAREYAAARARLAAVSTAEPANAEAAYYLGRVAIVDGDAKAAVAYLERAVRLAPRTAAYHHWLGRAYGRQVRRVNRVRQAFVAKKIRRAFQTAVALDPSDVAARRDLLQFYLVAPGIVGGSVDRARAQARELAARSPMLGRVAAGWIAEASNDNAAAERAYLDAVAQYPDSAEPYLALGALYQRTEAWDRAFDVYDRLLRACPREVQAYYQLGRAASLSGRNLDRGARALQTYLAEKPGEGDAPLASAHYRLGLIYEWQGRAEQAREQYATSLRLDPGQRDARDALRRLP